MVQNCMATSKTGNGFLQRDGLVLPQQTNRWQTFLFLHFLKRYEDVVQSTLENFLLPAQKAPNYLETCVTLKQQVLDSHSSINDYFVQWGQGEDDKFRAALASRGRPCAAVIGAAVASCDTEGRGSRL